MQLKNFFNKRIDNIIQNDEEMANNQDIDNNKISLILNISSILKGLHLIIALSCFSYFAGLMWFIICDLKTAFEGDGESYLTYFGIQN